MNLVGFITTIYHDARSPERQNSHYRYVMTITEAKHAKVVVTWRVLFLQCRVSCAVVRLTAFFYMSFC